MEILEERRVLSTVSVSYFGPDGGENGEPVKFLVSRSPDNTGALTVNYTLSGEASEGVDYPTQSGSVTILDFMTFEFIQFTPIDDAIDEGLEDVIITLTSGSYSIGTGVATQHIVDNDSIVTVTAIASTVETCPCLCTCGTGGAAPSSGGGSVGSIWNGGTPGPSGSNSIWAGGSPGPSGSNSLWGGGYVPPGASSMSSTQGSILPDASIFSKLRYDSTTAQPVALMQVDLTVGPSIVDGSDIDVEYFWNGDTFPTVEKNYDSDGVDAFAPYRAAAAVDASSLGTGYYPWSVDVKTYNPYGSMWESHIVYSGTTVVDRTDSEFGKGWSNTAVDRLAIQSDGAVFAPGRGGASWFSKDISGDYHRPDGEPGFSELVYDSGSYILTTADGETSTFNSLGFQTLRADRYGNEIAYAYTDADSDTVADEISTITDWAGRVTTFGYTGDLVTTITDAYGKIVTLGYASGKLISVTEDDPDGAGPLSAPVTAFGYTGNILTSHTDPAGDATTFAVDDVPDGPYYVTGVQYPSGAETAMQSVYALALASNTELVKVADLRATETDALENDSYIHRDDFGNPTKIVDADGNTTLIDRDADGRVLSVLTADPDGAGPESEYFTEYEYDAAGNLLSITLPDESTQEWTYDAIFNIATSYTDALGAVTLFDIDPTYGYVLETRRVVGDPDDEINLETDDVVTSFTYTPLPSSGGDPPAGLLETVTDPLGRVTVYEYNEVGLPTTVTFADGTADEAFIEFEYDVDDNLAATIDELGRRTEYEYDALRRLIQITQEDPDGAGPLASPVSTFEYDAYGRVVLETDALGRETSYEYEDGRLISVTRPDHDGDTNLTVAEFTYTDRDELETVTDPLGRVTEYIYNALGQNSQIILPDPDGGSPLASPVLQFAYDALGRPRQTLDPLGNPTDIAYADEGLSATVTQADPDGAGAATRPETTSEFDAVGNVISTTDALGNETSFEYDELHRLTLVTLPDPDGVGGAASPELEYEYDKAGNLRYTTDPLGNVTEYQYDNRNRLVKIIQADPDAGGSLAAPETDYAYDDAGQLLTTTDPLGNVTTYAYDDLGRTTSVTAPDPDGVGGQAASVTTMTYDAVGNLLTVTDGLSHTTEYEYDAHNNRVLITDAESGETSFTYDDNGALLTLTDPVGNVTEWVYDGLGRTIEETNELNDTRYFVYDAASNLVKRTDRNEREIEFVYDHLNRRTAERWGTVASFPTAGVSTSTQGGAGNEVQTVGVTASGTIFGGTFALTYSGQTTSGITYNASAATVQTALEALSNIGSGDVSVSKLTNTSTSQTWQVTFQGALADTNVSQTTINVSSIMAMGSKSAVQTTDTQGATGNEVQVVTLTSATGGAFTLGFGGETTAPIAYNASAGTVETALESLSTIDNVSVTGSAGGPYTVTFQGTQSGQNVASLTADDSGLTNSNVVRTLSWTYDANGRVTNAADPAAEYDYVYDNLGRRTSVTHNLAGLSFDVELLSTFNAASSRTELAAIVDGDDDFVNEYDYDDLHRLIQIAQHGVGGGNSVAEKRVDFAYDAKGQWDTITRYADLAGTDLVATSTYIYDDASRLTDLTHAKGVTTLADYTWAYDLANRITTFTNGLYSAESATYSYDTTNQVTGADRSGGANDETYAYDANGNRTGGSYDTDPNNQLATDGTYNYEYDDEGNRTKKTTIATGAYVSYEWDFRNRLTAVRFKTSGHVVTKQVEYEYDVDNRRTSRRVDSNGDNVYETAQRFVYDGPNIVLVYNASGDLANRYLHGPATDQILADEDALGDVLWPLADNQGTIRDFAAYDAGLDSTTVVKHLAYNSYGAITSDSAPTVGFLYSYTGREWDPIAELYYYRARWYDAERGRFISEDPIRFAANDTNLARYVANAPQLYNDSTGLILIDPEDLTWEQRARQDLFNEAAAWEAQGWFLAAALLRAWLAGESTFDTSEFADHYLNDEAFRAIVADLALGALNDGRGCKTVKVDESRHVDFTGGELFVAHLGVTIRVKGTLRAGCDGRYRFEGTVFVSDGWSFKPLGFLWLRYFFEKYRIAHQLQVYHPEEYGNMRVTGSFPIIIYGPPRRYDRHKLVLPGNGPSF